MPHMAADPLPLHNVAAGFGDRRMPELEVLDLAALPLPTSCIPPMHPFGHPLHEILRIGREHDAESGSLTRNRAKGFDDTPKGHPIVRCRRLRDPVVESREALRRRVPVLDYTGSPARVASLSSIAQARLVRKDRQ